MTKQLLLTALFLFLASPLSAEDCTKCHPIPTDRSHIVHSAPDIVSPQYGSTGITGTYAGKAAVYGYSCGNCHPVGRDRHGNGSVDIELYSPEAAGLKKLNRPDASYDRQGRTCSGIYCHSSGSGDFRKSPPWGGSSGEARCQGCHGSPPAYESRPGRENSHFNSERGSGHLLGIHWDSTGSHTKESFAGRTSSDMGCSTCHYDTVSVDRDMSFVDPVSGLFTCSRCHDNKSVMGRDRQGGITNTALHVNGAVEVSFRPEKFRTTAQLMRLPEGWNRMGEKPAPGSYDETVRELNAAQYIPREKKCLNVACHLLGREVKWGDKIDCDACHKDIGSGSGRSRH